MDDAERPQLILNLPTCSGCHGEVVSDADGYSCPECHVYWGYSAGDYEPGEWDGTEPAPDWVAAVDGTEAR